MTNDAVVNADDIATSDVVATIERLTLAGRKFPLAVFRQLPLAPLLNALSRTWEPSGRALGRVEYFGQGVRDYGDTLHVLWLKGDRLCRDVVHKIPVAMFELLDVHRDQGVLDAPALDDALKLPPLPDMLLANVVRWLEAADECKAAKAHGDALGAGTDAPTYYLPGRPGRSPNLSIRAEYRAVWPAPPPPDDGGPPYGSEARLARDELHAKGARQHTTDSAQAQARLAEQLDHHRALLEGCTIAVDAYERQYRALALLPQLFIGA